MRFEYKEWKSDTEGGTEGVVEDLNTNEVILIGDSEKAKKFLKTSVRLMNDKFEEDEYYDILY